MLTADANCFDAAREGIDYERSVYSGETGNWADFWKQDQPLYMWSWCHGAPGIGLARLGTLAALDTPKIREDLERAVATTVRFGIRPIDHLCCGNLGRVELFLETGRRLSRPDLVQLARLQASRVVARARSSGGYLIHPLMPKGIPSPGFFQGMAGIGYALLRIARPDELPSVLLWE